MNISHKYHYFYKITNLINNHFYYGVHNTDNLDDGYMGSGTKLKIAYKKYGIENFKKEILKFFDTSKEAFEYEAEIVNESLVYDDSCYNIQQGGIGFNSEGTILVKDKNENYFRCTYDDPKYLSGEYIATSKNQVTVRDDNGNCFNVNIDDKRYLTGELKGINYKKAVYRNKKTGKYELLDKNNEIDKELYEGITRNKICVYDETGKYFLVDINDERYVSGKLKFMLNKYRSDEKVISKRKNIYKLINHQQGEKNSQYGTCWIHNDKENKKIKKDELENYINDGWIKGRKMKFN